MQDHLKERLTGAVILVFIVVLLVPEMFRGRPSVAAGQASSGVEGLPLRSVTIDLRDAPSAQPPTSPEIAPASPIQSPALASTAAPPLAMTTAPASTLASALASAPATTAQVPAPVPVPLPAASAPQATETPGSTRWAVQVGSFSHRELAELMVKQVRAKGFAVQVAGPDDRGHYRVRSATHDTRAAAQALQQKMLAVGLKSIISTAP